MHFWGHPWLASAVYPVGQTAIIGAVLVPRREVVRLTGALVAAALLGVLLFGFERPSAFFHVVAWGVLASIAWHLQPSALRTALLLAFGLNLIPWVALTIAPSWTTWGVYQGVRAVSLGWFCWAQTERAVA